MYGDDIIMLDDSLHYNDARDGDSIIIIDSDEEVDKRGGYDTDRHVIESSFLSLPSTSHLSESASSVDIIDTSLSVKRKSTEMTTKTLAATSTRNRVSDASDCYVPDSEDECAPQDVSMANESFGPVESSPSIGGASSFKSLDSFPDASDIGDMSYFCGAADDSISIISSKIKEEPLETSVERRQVSMTTASKLVSSTSLHHQRESETIAQNRSNREFRSSKDSTVSNSSGISEDGLELSRSSVQNMDRSAHHPHERGNVDKVRRSNDSSYVSLKEESPRLTEKQQCLVKISELSDEIRMKRDVLKSVDLSTLPDRGVRLQLAVSNLDRELRQLRQEYNNMPDDDEPRALNNSSGDDSDSSVIVEHVVQPKVLKSKDMNSQNKASSNSGGSHTFAMIRGMDSVTMDSLKNLHDSLKTCPGEDVKADDPEGLKIPLMPHQRHGLAWMLWREQQVPTGGILADDMGLGKTLSMISLILKHKELLRDGKIEDNDGNLRGGTLIVCPTSLLGQWKNEVDRRCKQSSLSVCIHHGTDRSGIKSMRRHDIVITTYGIVMRECASIQKKASSKAEDGPLHTLDWTRIILDEAHVVRNHKSKTSQAVCCLKGKYRWALTGTPIHNKELDLFALIVFLQCSPFDKFLTWRRWVDNKTAAGAQRLNMLMKSLMLRRTKEQLQSAGSLNSLPERQLHQIKIELEPEEQAVYDQILILSRNLFAKFMDQHAARMESKLSGELGSQISYSSGQSGTYSSGISDIWSNPSLPGSGKVAMRNIPDDKTVKSHHLLVLLLRLRQICCHPGLIQSMLEAEDYKTDGIVDDSGLDVDLISQLNNISLIQNDGDDESSNDDKNPLTIKNPVFRLNRPSTKINALFSCLKENVFDKPDKAVLVSQWTSVLDLIGDHLKRNGIKFFVLNGTVPLKTRTEIVESFNNNPRGPKVLLLSLKAGGVGLNLVGGNHLLLVDLHWNPQLEAQACDRIYRVGQKKEVHIYRFICKHTVEEKIHDLQEKKLTMAENVLTGAKNPQSNKLTLEDLKLLFTSSAPT
ncbi:transcription termination factor 2-like [Ischnura elegans]|uniref:transcription termination factor 2-like n=1 Tax=Ischnura elegans TaxID=197161 RepID=UPI001ED88C86|nr:transcription termination factor 2-like [Ischnura elegans]